MSDETAPPPAPPPRRRPSRAVAWSLATGIALAVLVAVALTWVRSGHALRTVLDEAVARSGGRLAIEGAHGSLAGRVAVDRLVWRDDGTEVVAEGVVLAFAPWRLLDGTLAIQEATAQRVTATLAPGDDEPFALPESIAPPLAIDVDRLAVATLAWRRGEDGGTLTGLALAYEGDDDGHRIRDLRVATDGATLAGGATIGARRPFDLDVAATLDLAAPHPAGRVQATARGSLAALAVEGTSTLAGIAARGRVDLAPLAPQPIVAGHVEATDVDLAAIDAALPATRLAVVVDAKPAPGGFAGTLQASNGTAGPLDRQRLPLASLASAFALRDRVLTLSSLDARVAGGGTIAGSGSVALDGWRNRWKLDVARLDLARLHSSLRTTALAGRIEADVEADVQRVVADLAQDDVKLAFAARYDGTTVVAERFAAQAGGGTLSGTGRIALAGARPFAVEARAQRFDPARFGAFPAGTIDATLRAEGTAANVPAARADLAVAKGSRLAGLPLAGRVQGRFTPDTAEDVDATVTLGASRLTAQGAVRRLAPSLALAFASTDLAELRPLVPADVPALAGRVDAKLRVEPRGRGVAFALDARGERLRVGDDYAVATLQAEARGVHDAPLRSPRVEALADVNATLVATGLVAPQGRLDRATLALQGSAASHTLSAGAVQGNVKAEVRAAGAAAALAATPRWRGRVDALAVEGLPAFARVALAAPTDVELAPDVAVVGPARIEGGATVVDVEGFAWRAGRLETRGRFRGLPVAPVARQAGIDTRWPMDVVLGGRWDVASTPAWQGTLVVERERGDVYVEEPGDEATRRVALGLDALRVEATLEGPRLAATGELRAKLAGNTLVDATLQAPAGHAHPFDPSARLAGTVRAHVPALSTLQPWIGTAARVQGQAIAEVNLGGTLGDPSFTGQLVAYGLGVDMPQYGIRLADGRVRVVSGPEGLVLETLEFAGGAGRFTAAGTVALPGERGAGGRGTRIAWKAENFRLLNHPDRRLVVDGEGTLARRDERWLLAGRIAVDEGVIAYRSTEDTQLADDIVVVGRPRPARAAPGGSVDAPVDVDLALELGRNFRFAAEGLETRLAGKLQLVSRKGEPISARGTIRAQQGTYNAFGQRLAIERGRLVFDGPVANPSLDIVALRKNLAVEAGVEITGTVRAPLVRLTSNPPVPDNEKLSWLLTGGPPGAATQREAVALAAAQAALAGRGGGKTLTQRFAENIGVDDISFLNRGDGKGEDVLAGQVVSVGKRITDRLYVAYEQGLELANNALRLEYVLSRYFTVSAFAGSSSGVELKFRRNWR